MNMGRGCYILASFLFFSLKFIPAHGAMNVNVLTPGGHGALYPGDTLPYAVTFDAPRDHVPSAPLYVVLVPTPDSENPNAPRPIFPWTLTLSNRTTTDASREIPPDLNVFGTFTIDIHSGKDVYGPLLASSNKFTISPLPLHRKILNAPFVIQTTWGTYLKFLTIYGILVYIWIRWKRRHLQRKLAGVINQAIAQARAQGRAEARRRSRGALVPVPSFLMERNQANLRPFPSPHQDIEAGNIEGGMAEVDEPLVTSDNVDIEAPLINLHMYTDAPLQPPPTLPAYKKDDSALSTPASKEGLGPTMTALMVQDPYCEPLAGLSVGQAAPSSSSSTTIHNNVDEQLQSANAVAARLQQLTTTVEHLQTLLALRSGSSEDPTLLNAQGEDESQALVPPPTYSEASRYETA